MMIRKKIVGSFLQPAEDLPLQPLQELLSWWTSLNTGAIVDAGNSEIIATTSINNRAVSDFGGRVSFLVRFAKNRLPCHLREQIQVGVSRFTEL